MTFIKDYEGQLVDAAKKQKVKDDRQQLIDYLETEGTFLERLWLPLIRFVHRRCS